MYYANHIFSRCLPRKPEKNFTDIILDLFLRVRMKQKVRHEHFFVWHPEVCKKKIVGHALKWKRKMKEDKTMSRTIVL